MLWVLVPVLCHAQYPDNIYPDTTYAPFYYGVASGDPLSDRVIIWTKVHVSAADSAASVPLRWELAADQQFNQTIQRGSAMAAPDHDHTVKIDVTGLQAAQSYYYRFQTADGKYSQTGICRTLPADGVKHFKLGIVSCSSVWSGYFNAYRRIADRPDIDYVVHLGDYVYDYADKEELNRMPTVSPVRAGTLAQWRERHTYYLLDPDLRAARQNKTWIAEWDNHDTRGKEQEAIQAFYEYLPIRVPDTTHPERIYRTFHFGGLADLNMIDMHLFRGKEKYPDSGIPSVLGVRQDTWLKEQLKNSTATWKLIGNQEMMGSWLREGLPSWIPGDGKVFDDSNWDGFFDDRNKLYDFLDSNKIKNFVVLTGDAHMSFVIDLAKTPKDKKTYNRHTGEGAVGVEFLEPSVTRGNMSDTKRVPKGFIPLIQTVSNSVNPHHVWVNFAKHGYGTIDVTPERCVAEYWYLPIHKKTSKEKFGRGFTVKQGVSHWEHKYNKHRSKSTYPKP